MTHASFILATHGKFYSTKKAEIGVGEIFNELNGIKLSLNINKTVFVAFAIRNVYQLFQLMK